jgi:hypothetical protein
METGAGAPVATVTAAVGYPTIITKTSHGLGNGDVVTLSAFAGASAALMNTLVVVVKNVTTNTLAVDIDTTGGTLTAANGTLTPVTMTEVGSVVDINREDPGANEIDTTHLRSTSKEYLIGLRDPGTVTFSLNWVANETGQIALRAAQATRAVTNFKITYPDLSTMTFAAYVKQVSGPSAAVDGKLGASATLRISGDITITP